jgi:hypothetical protein
LSFSRPKLAAFGPWLLGLLPPLLLALLLLPLLLLSCCCWLLGV